MAHAGRRRWLIGALALFLGAAAQGARAATISDCITIDSIALSQAYNPFTTATSVQTLNLTVRRATAANPKTQEADFVFVQPQNDSTPYQITYGATSVLYPFPGPSLSTTGPNPNTIVADFGGNAQSATQVFTVLVTMPAGANIPAGTFVIPFGIDAVCKFNGKPTITGTLVDPFNISLTVRSALQAYFAGPALDFGAITNVTTATAGSRTVSGFIHVSSSGPYSVALASGNNFRMTFPGGNLSAANQRVAYRLSFLGQMRDVASPSFTTANCHFTGISGNDLAIAATLQEGGAGKTPAPNYQDLLTVTITPLAVPPGDVYPACS